VGEITVRLASEDDYRDLAGLRWRWRTDERDEATSDPQAWTDEFVSWLHDHSATHIAVVATHDGDAIGEGWLAVVDRIPNVTPTPPAAIGERRSGYLQSVYVTPPHRGVGIGKQIVDLLVADARDRGLAYLSVHPSERSFSLYRRAGFADSNRVLQLRF
jgi:GNAT superfamily N-acetyltransferase